MMSKQQPIFALVKVSPLGESTADAVDFLREHMVGVPGEIRAGHVYRSDSVLERTFQDGSLIDGKHNTWVQNDESDVIIIELAEGLWLKAARYVDDTPYVCFRYNDRDAMVAHILDEYAGWDLVAAGLPELERYEDKVLPRKVEE